MDDEVLMGMLTEMSAEHEHRLRKADRDEVLPS